MTDLVKKAQKELKEIKDQEVLKVSTICVLLGSAGLDQPVFGSFINDKGERVLSKNVKKDNVFSHFHIITNININVSKILLHRIN